MKTLGALIFLIISHNSFCQEKIDWKNIAKIELHSLSKTNACGNIKSKDINDTNLINCDTEKLRPYLKSLNAPKTDVISEKRCDILRIIYKNKKSKDFIIQVNQGVLISRDPFYFIEIKDKEPFIKLLLSFLK